MTKEEIKKDLVEEIRNGGLLLRHNLNDQEKEAAEALVAEGVLVESEVNWAHKLGYDLA